MTIGTCKIEWVIQKFGNGYWESGGKCVLGLSFNFSNYQGSKETFSVLYDTLIALGVQHIIKLVCGFYNFFLLHRIARSMETIYLSLVQTGS